VVPPPPFLSLAHSRDAIRPRTANARKIKEVEKKEGRWRNHRTPGKSSDQEMQEQEKSKRKKRKKGGGGTTALQGSHQNKKCKKSKKSKKGGGAITRSVRLSPKATVRFLFHGHCV
jgi:hypothetical protein